MIRSTAGQEGMRFFPLVYSIFMFILVSNLIGIIPYTFTVSSHITITAAFALLVFFTVLIYGFYKNGSEIFYIHKIQKLRTHMGRPRTPPVWDPTGFLRMVGPPYPPHVQRE
jgi:F0F1-type ATP synthase membrane subunit a